MLGLEKTIAALDHDVKVCRSVTHYPPESELIRIIRAHAPEVVFLSFADVERAQEIVAILEKEIAGLQIIAIHHQVDVTILRETMRLGIREFVAEPFDLRLLCESLGNVKRSWIAARLSSRSRTKSYVPPVESGCRNYHAGFEHQFRYVAAGQYPGCTLRFRPEFGNAPVSSAP